jgi:hypothetical protein
MKSPLSILIREIFQTLIRVVFPSPHQISVCLLQTRHNTTHTNLGCDYPYLVAILSQNIIEIRSIRPSFLIQKFSMNKAIMLTSGV